MKLTDRNAGTWFHELPQVKQHLCLYCSSKTTIYNISKQQRAHFCPQCCERYHLWYYSFAFSCQDLWIYIENGRKTFNICLFICGGWSDIPLFQPIFDRDLLYDKLKTYLLFA
jgi:hypothetical protein